MIDKLYGYVDHATVIFTMCSFDNSTLLMYESANIEQGSNISSGTLEKKEAKRWERKGWEGREKKEQEEGEM